MILQLFVVAGIVEEVDETAGDEELTNQTKVVGHLSENCLLSESPLISLRYRQEQLVGYPLLTSFSRNVQIRGNPLATKFFRSINWPILLLY